MSRPLMTTDPVTDRIPVQRTAEPVVDRQRPAPADRGPRSARSLIVAAVAGLVVGVGGTAATVAAVTPAPAPAAPAAPTTSAAPAVPASFTISGSLTVSATSSYGTGLTSSGGSCEGTGGYGDIGPGTGVTVTDAGGQIVATGYLGSGTGTSSACTFPFTVVGVPGTSAFYSIEVASRGTVTFPRDQLRTGSAMLTLGED